MRVLTVGVLAITALSSLAFAPLAAAEPAAAPVAPVTAEIPLDLAAAAAEQAVPEAATVTGAEETPASTAVAPDAAPAPEAAPPEAGQPEPDPTASAAPPPVPFTVPAAEPAPVLIEKEVDGTFSAVGFRYEPTANVPGIEVRVREDGTWSEWEALAEPDGGPDEGSAEAARAAARVRTVTTEPLLATQADAFEVRVTPTGGELPTGFAALTIDPGESAADATPTATPAFAASELAAQSVSFESPSPQIISRAEWGADESLRTADPECAVPDYDTTIKVGFVHHTASTNSYDAVTALQQLRSIYAYHVQGFGWCDFGYNFLVDKYGRLFEGRWGGVDRPVHGAHTGGFNTDTFAVSALGNYQDVPPSTEMVSTIAHVLGWKLGLYNRNPFGQATLVSAGGGTSRYPAGVAVTFNVVSGHRDPGATLCPGQYLYDRLPEIRPAADRISRQTYTVISGVTPVNQQVNYGSGAAGISLFVPSSTYWEVAVVEACTGQVVRRLSGYVERGTLALSWDLRSDGGQLVRGGAYSWYLRTAVGGSAAGGIDVIPPPERASGPASAASITGAGFVPIQPVRIADSRQATTQPLGAGSSRNIRVLGVGGVPAAGVAGVALNITAVCATGVSYFTAWPAGSSQPGTSSLNLVGGNVVPGLVVTPVGADGQVSVYNAAGSAHLIVDVVGYFPTSGGSTLRQTGPTRLLDGWSAPLAAGESRTLPVAQTVGAPTATVTGAVVNVTIAAAGATPGGFVGLNPGGTGQTSTSTLNVVPGRDATNRALVGVRDGVITVTNSVGAAHVFVDLVGYFVSDGSGSRYTSVTPTRIVDSRAGQGTSGPWGLRETRSVTVSGVGPVPGNAAAVMATLTSDRVSAPTFFIGWAAGSQPPGTSDLNSMPGIATANAALLWPGAGRAVSLFNFAGRSDVILDVVGYFR